MAAKTPESDPAQDGDTKSPPAAAPSPKPKPNVAELKKAFEPTKKPAAKIVAAHVAAVKKLRGKLDPVMTETANGVKTPEEDVPAEDEDEEPLPDHVRERLAKTAEELDKKDKSAYAAHLRDEQSRIRIALANRRKRGTQCTYIGANGVQHHCFPQNPTPHGRCSIHKNSRSYAKCTIDGCVNHTRSELGICTKCQTRATAAELRQQEREKRLSGLKHLLRAGADLPDLEGLLAELAPKRDIAEARAAVEADDE